MSSPHGNLTGLKPNQLRRLEHVYRRRVPEDAIISLELARFCTGLSHEIGRQIGVLINRRGAVEDVIVGNDREVVLPDLSGYRLGRRSLRGIRLVHTHLRGEPLSQDDLTDLALLRLDLIAAVGVNHDGQPGHLYAANILPPNQAGKPYEIWKPVALQECDVHLGEFLRALEEELSRTRPAHPTSRPCLSAAASQAAVSRRQAAAFAPCSSPSPRACSSPEGSWPRRCPPRRTWRAPSHTSRR